MKAFVGPAVCKRCEEIYEMDPFTEEMFNVTIDEDGRAHSYITSSRALSSFYQVTKKTKKTADTRTESEREADSDLIEEFLAREPVTEAQPKRARAKRSRGRIIDRSPVDIMSIVAERKRREAERAARKPEAEIVSAEA
jgi:hypothetical protein